MIAVGLELGARLAERVAARRRGRDALRLDAVPRRAGVVCTLSRLLTIAEARRLFSPETTYLNAASYGLPPRPAVEALRGARSTSGATAGRTGTSGTGRSGESRAAWARAARRAGAPTSRSRGQVSAFTGLVALSLRARRARGVRGARLHVGDLAVPGRRRRVDAGAARAARRGDRRRHGGGRGQRRAVDRRARGRPRRDRRGRCAPRRADVRRRHAGERLAAARRGALRLPDGERLQVAALAARDVVHGGAARRRPSGCGRTWPAGTRATTRSTPTTTRRCGWPTTPAASTSRRRG